ncbi:MAG: hypothetical protein WKF89_11635, partial [Chitinophagaceae bacterium]
MKKSICIFVSIFSLIAFQHRSVAQTNQGNTTGTTVNTGNDTAMGKRKAGDPFAVLPSNIERLTLFGERADISPDNKRV